MSRRLPQTACQKCETSRCVRLVPFGTTHELRPGQLVCPHCGNVEIIGAKPPPPPAPPRPR